MFPVLTATMKLAQWHLEHTQEELVWGRGGFPNCVCREDCIGANSLHEKKAPCSGAVGILFFLVFWHAKLKSLVNQIPRANTCSLHTGPLKPKLLPNYSGCFLLFIGKEWWPSTRGQQQAPGTCSSTSKFISVTLGGTGLSNEGLIRALSVCTPRHAICCIFQP